MARLEEQGIATRQGTHAPVATGYYAQQVRPATRRTFPNAYLADRLTLALPLYPQMTDADQDTVVDALRGAFEDDCMCGIAGVLELDGAPVAARACCSA